MTNEEEQRKDIVNCLVNNKRASIHSTRDIERQRRELFERWKKHYRSPITPVTFTTIDGKNVAIKDESQNSTDTYKEQHGSTMAEHYLQHAFPEEHTYYLVSTGNAAFSDFVYAERINKLVGEQKVRVINFWPKHYDTKLLGPDSHGRFTTGKRFRQRMEDFPSGRNEVVDFTEAFWDTETCRKHLNKQGLNLTPENSTDITEGFNPTYEPVMKYYARQIQFNEWIEREDLLRQFPKTLLVVQYGAGMLHDDCKKVIREQQLPIDVLAVSTNRADTIADKMCDTSGRWQDHTEIVGKQGTSTARKTGDIIYHVTDQEILFALQQMRAMKDMEAESTGAGGLAILPRLETIIGKERLDKYDLLAFINTGNGIRETAYENVMNTKE